MSTKNKRIICMILMLAIVIQALLPIRVYAHTANGHYTTAQVPGKWIKSGTYWYWQKTNGTNLTSAFLDYDGSTYYLAANGVMGVGWMKIDGNWYYFQNWGGMYRDTFVEYDGNTYYLASNGVMGVGWMKIDGNWYYFYNWGGAVKGWKKLTYPTEYGGDEYWNYFNSSGVFITDSDVEGCSHGRSTFSDYHLITGIPFTYYTNLGTSQDANIKKGADAWGSKYLSRTTNKNKATLTFEYDSFIYNTQNARTLFQIDLSVVDHVTTNFDGAIIQFNKDKGIASASTVAHEVGHVLGLSHRISEKSSIMYYLSEGRKVSTPQTIDFSNAAHVN